MMGAFMTYEEIVAALRRSDALGDCVPAGIAKAARDLFDFQAHVQPTRPCPGCGTLLATWKPTGMSLRCPVCSHMVREKRGEPSHHVVVQLDGVTIDPSCPPRRSP